MIPAHSSCLAGYRARRSGRGGAPGGVTIPNRGQRGPFLSPGYLGWVWLRSVGWQARQGGWEPSAARCLSCVVRTVVGRLACLDAEPRDRARFGCVFYLASR